MPITLKETGGSYTPPPEGTHLAICFRLCDVGTQPDSGFGERHKLVISWELPNELLKMPDGQTKPMSVSKTYTFSLNNKANLRQDLVRWRGREFNKEELKGFSLGKVLGKPCQLSIVHTEAGKGKVDSVFAAPKGMQAPKPVNPLVEYSIEQGKDKTYEALPEWLRKMVDEGLLRVAQQGEDEHVPEAPDEPPQDAEVPF